MKKLLRIVVVNVEMRIIRWAFGRIRTHIYSHCSYYSLGRYGIEDINKVGKYLEIVIRA